MERSQIKLCAQTSKKQLPIERRASRMPAVLEYIVRAVKYQAGVPMCRVRRAGRAFLTYLNYLR